MNRKFRRLADRKARREWSQQKADIREKVSDVQVGALVAMEAVPEGLRGNLLQAIAQNRIASLGMFYEVSLPNTPLGGSLVLAFPSIASSGEIQVGLIALPTEESDPNQLSKALAQYRLAINHAAALRFRADYRQAKIQARKAATPAIFS